MTGHSECIYPDNGVEYGIHPSPRQGSNPRFLYKVVRPVNFRWSNWVVNCKLVLIVNMTGTAVRKTISHIFQRCSFCLFLPCHVMMYCMSLDIQQEKWESQMRASVGLRASVSACLCVLRSIRQGSVSCCLSAIQWRDGWTHAVVSCWLLSNCRNCYDKLSLEFECRVTSDVKSSHKYRKMFLACIEWFEPGCKYPLFRAFVIVPSTLPWRITK